VDFSVDDAVNLWRASVPTTEREHPEAASCPAREDLTVRMLLPEPRDDVDPSVAYDDPRRARHDGRPWVLVNMISSLDGASSVEGVSGGLGGPGDRAIFAVLRNCADIILVGAETARTEQYGPPRKPGQQVAVVSRRANLALDTPLFTSGAGFLVLPEDGPDVPVRSLRAGRGGVDLAGALRQIDADVLLAEGGPTINGALLDSGLIDELCLTFAPLLVGGDSSRIVGGTRRPTPMQLAHLLEEDGYLFGRYVRG
jgi:riboflavin biosynthesis pyrimidine reductase